MDNIIQPKQPEVSQPRTEGTAIPQELMDIGLNMDNLGVMDYLGVKGEMFEDETMEKINDISDFIKGSELDIQTIDLRLGNPHDMTRLDKIYSYVQLEKQTQVIREKEQLINKEKAKYDTL